MAEPKTLTARLNFLFATVRPVGEEREFTNSEIAAATGVSASYIGYLRKGVRDNPSVETVQALARFFGVRPSYLVDEDIDEAQVADIEAQLRLVRALQNPAVKRLAMRAAESDLSPTALDAITAMIDEVRKREQGRARGRPAPSRRRTGSP